MTINKPRNKRFLLGPIIIVGALVSLVATGMKSNTLRAVPVNELRAADATKTSFVSQRLRVVGRITQVPVRKTDIRTANGTVQLSRFSVEEKGEVLNVEYRDFLPDTFRAGGPVQVDGVYTAPGIMQADHVLTKCPSKYEGAKSEGAKDKKNKGDDYKSAPPKTNAKTASLTSLTTR